MSEAAEILVIILSVVLTIFLIIGSILIVYLIKLVRQVNNIADTAEKTVDNFEMFVANLSKAVSPMVVTEAIAKIFRSFKKDKKSEDDTKEEK